MGRENRKTANIKNAVAEVTTAKEIELRLDAEGKLGNERIKQRGQRHKSVERITELKVKNKRLTEDNIGVKSN